MYKLIALKDISAIKIAITLCNATVLKKEIVGASDSEFYDYLEANPHERNTGNLEKIWKAKIDEKTELLIASLSIPTKHKDFIRSKIQPISFRMLVWTKYIQAILGLEPSLFEYINVSFFTTQGDVNTEKTVITLLENERFEIERRYKLACLYCLEQHIQSLWKKLTLEEKEDSYIAGNNPQALEQNKLVGFWSHYLMKKKPHLMGNSDPNHYLFTLAIESGNMFAVKYSWKKLNSTQRAKILNPSIISTVFGHRRKRSDSIVAYLSHHLPNTLFAGYYIDIIRFLLIKMEKEQQIESLEAAISTIINFNKKDYKEDIAKLISLFLSKKNINLLINSNRPYTQSFFKCYFSEGNPTPSIDYSSELTGQYSYESSL